MKCSECGYYWKEEDEGFAHCQFDGPDGWAPCECGDDFEEDCDD